MRGYFLIFILFSSSLYAEDINDPFEDINRVTFEFNESLDRNFLKPVAQTYSKAPKLAPQCLALVPHMHAKP